MTGWGRRGGRRVRAAVVALAMALPAVARAQPPADDGFVTMTPDQMAQEALPAAPFVFAAYAVAWVAVLAYVLVLWRKQARLERELERVQAELRSGGTG